MAGPLGTDVALALVDSRALSIYRVRHADRRVTAGGQVVRRRDLVTLSDRDNLAQALTTRLLTPRGELGPLGHPDYGSRLHEVIGAPNTATTRNLAKLFVIEALKQERRVDRIASVAVEPHQVNRFLISISIRVLPVGDDAALDVGPLLVEL